MKTFNVIFLLITVLILGCASSSFSQAPEQSFQKGLMKEKGEGDLNAAIDIYNEIVSNQAADKSLQAKALLHVGLCYEKLGRTEATKAYQNLVNNFPGQKNEVAIARERLNKLLLNEGKVAAEPLNPKFIRVSIPTEIRSTLKLSPDGKELALVTEKKIWKMPLSGNLGPNYPGTPVQLNTGDIEVLGSGLAWSGDGKWIAFNEVGASDKDTLNIYTVSSKGGKPKKIIECFRDASMINYQLSLSPKGKMLAYSSIDDRQQHFKTISVKGGKAKQLTDIMAREPAFSPNGKLIAFVEDKDMGKFDGEQGIWTIPAKGGKANLVAEAGKATSPIWSPDGKMIAFVDLNSVKHINIIPVSNSGKAAGEVTKIDVPDGIEWTMSLAGWTPGNKIGALLSTYNEQAIYTLPAAGGQAAIVLNDCYASAPRWSPDGKQIFFTTEPAEGVNKIYRLTLASVSATGGVRKFLPQAAGGKKLRQFSQGGNRISPDGKTIISAAYCTDDTLANIDWPGSHIWKISIDGTEQTKITEIDGPYVDMSPSWSPDGKKVAFVRTKLNKPPTNMFGESNLYTVSSSGGNPKLLIAESGKWLVSPVWSHDGKMIAYLTREKNNSETTKALNVINVSTGKSRVVGKVPAVHFQIDLAWSPDSRRIAFNDNKGEVIKVISLDDGSIEDIRTNLGDVQIYQLDWSPDGERFVFCGVKYGKTEFWFLEDFLPLKGTDNK